jgi:hypothetical protein
MKPWSPKEEAVLRAHWPKGGMAAVIDLLPGRSRSSIHGRVEKLGLHVAARDVIRKPGRPKGYDCSSMDVAFWLATWVFSERPRVPDLQQIMDRWNVSISTAHRWRRWGLDKLEQVRARESMSQQERENVSHIH